MAQLSGSPQVFHSSTTDADSSAQVALGTHAFDANGNQYVYLRGTASTVAGSWVIYDLNGSSTTLASANGVGPLAIAGTATTTNLYGWYQVFGKATGNTMTSIAASKALYLTATAGYADDTDVAGDAIIGACSLAASSGSATVVWLNYPFVSDIAID
jgi:hypothetical protein